jgi:hypothetical protein
VTVGEGGQSGHLTDKPIGLLFHGSGIKDFFGTEQIKKYNLLRGYGITDEREIHRPAGQH